MKTIEEKAMEWLDDKLAPFTQNIAGFTIGTDRNKLGVMLADFHRHMEDQKMKDLKELAEKIAMYVCGYFERGSEKDINASTEMILTVLNDHLKPQNELFKNVDSFSDRKYCEQYGIKLKLPDDLGKMATRYYPDFLYKNSVGRLAIGFYGDTVIEDEWIDWFKQFIRQIINELNKDNEDTLFI